MNRKSRPICHGWMGKGNNRCSRVIARVLAKSLLGAVNCKVKGQSWRHDKTRLPLALLLLQFQCTKVRIFLRKKKELEMATGIRPFQYEPVVDINFGICLCGFMCGIHVFLWRNKEVFDLTWHKSTEAKITVPTTNRWKAKLTLTNPSLTRPRSRNKCRRKEKCKMAALIRQTNSGYELANKPHKKEKRKKRRMVEEKREKTNNNNKQTLSEKKETAGNISEQRDKGWIHVIRVHDTTHLAVTTALRGSRRSRDYPPHETTPLTRTL